uniref:Cytochrome c biogenesis protein Ccs1 n=1 Tax=Polysiphonia elongata TaxID=159753 RepID=A0A1Z1MAZ3_9FLOR|nr:cytochrome c biogenesis protein ccs1 [Polysiphonia elongata]ARW63248.1 cytochrome c biogenesis protein ccs1 [Polysiphonia elongata]
MNNLNLKNLFWRFFKRLANLNLSLLILFLIIIACILGSILEQEQDNLYYAINYLNYSSLILFLGFDHVFRTWWFTLLLFTLGMTLMSCTFTTQMPSLKNARRWKFVYSKKISDSSTFDINRYSSSNYSLINFIYSLVHSDFFVFCRNSSIYSYKGLYGRVAPIFVHFSIVAILIGSIYGFFYSFVLQEITPVGEIFHLKNLVYSGFYSNLESKLFGHVDDFYIRYYNSGSVQQFFSKLSLYLNNQNSSVSTLIYVNKPLNFHGITFYQTDWELNSLRLSVNKDYFFQQNLIKKTDGGQVFWVSSLKLSENKKLLFVLNRLDSKVLICSDNGIILQEVLIGQNFYINSTSCCIENIISSTGLQIKYDPSISIVYFGFFVMIITTFLSYSSYSQIWIYDSSSLLEFVGSTNRATLFFEQDILIIDQIYLSYTDLKLNTLFKQILVLR